MQKKIKYISVDDERLALNKIDEFASQVTFLEKSGSFKNGLEAVTFLTQNHVDLVFMDINMEGLDGFQTIELMNSKPIVIITTAYSQHAIRGFDLDVCDYLLKPYSFERFVKAVNRAYKNRFPQNLQNENSKNISKKREYIFLKTEHSIQRVLLSEILFIKGMGDYLQVHLSERKFLVLMNFEEVGELLPSESFLRIHRSYLINLDKIKSIERKHVIINDNRLPISQSYKEAFLLFLKNNTNSNSK